MDESQKENEAVIKKIKSVACSTLKLSWDSASWETSLTKALSANALENINFLKVSEGTRVLFMPHSPGVYISLVLRNAEDLDVSLGEKDLNTSQISTKSTENAPAVKR